MNPDYKVITSENNNLAGNLIHTIDKNMLRIYNRELAQYGLTMQQSLVILYIANSEKEKVYQIDIERYLNLKNPSVTSLVKNLIANDYVYRIKDENDGRFFHLHLTPKSISLKDKLGDAIYSTNHLIEDCLSEEENRTLVRLLEKVAGMVKEKAKNSAEE